MRKIFIVSCALLFLSGSVVRADLSPKPEIKFDIQNMSHSSGSLLNGTLWQCSNADCADAKPLKSFGLQKFECSAQMCKGAAYGFTPYGKLTLEFSAHKITSNVFAIGRGLENDYVALVEADKIDVQSKQ